MSYATTVRSIQQRLPSELSEPEVLIICGSGLSGLSSRLSRPTTINYEDIPGFPAATVPGHAGELVFGKLGGLTCVCMRGRFHFYEGNTMKQVVFPVKIARLLGCKLLLVTNAAGGLNPDFNVGDIMVIQDHFGFPIAAGNNPFVGHNEDAFGPRFFAVSDCYDGGLQDIVLRESKTLGLERLIRPDGVYCYVSGPSYESRAECRFLRSIGGDSVGMSTIPEVLAARHCGMKILGLSMITNKVVIGDVKDKSRVEKHATHEEVLEAVKNGGKNVERLVEAIISEKNLRSFLNNVSPQKLELPPESVSSSVSCHQAEGSKGLASSLLFVNFFAILAVLRMNGHI